MKKKNKNKILLEVVLALSAALVIFFVLIFNNFHKASVSPEEKKQPAIKGEVVADPENTEKDATEESDTEMKEDIVQETEPETEEKQEDTQTQENVQNQEVQSAPSTVAEIQTQLNTLVSTEYAAGGSVAICAGRVDEADMAMVAGGSMQAASLIKLYVAGCVYENYGTVSSYESYAGETESLVSSMISVSDNDSCNTLVTRLGGGDAYTGMSLVNQYAANHGFTDTHMGRLMLQPNDVDDNYTSVRDCCNFLKMANAGQLEGSSSILGYMGQQQRRGKIPAGLPGGVAVGNKTGELANVENDAAIVYGNSGTYVLCVMSENLADTYSAQQFISRVSGVVYKAML